jgi:hypothetical protein
MNVRVKEWIERGERDKKWQKFLLKRENVLYVLFYMQNAIEK